ncbi:putative E3 ubiquitin-protein ligase HECTD4 [Glandiceps talaboti]
MASTITDNTQWLSVTEETLFLHDGLLRVTDIVELPHDVSSGNQSTELENEVVSFDSKNPTELSDRLLAVCGTRSNAHAYSRLLEYRQNALKGLWLAQRQMSNADEQSERDAASHEETIALLKKQGLWQQTEQAPFSSRVSLLLTFPLLKSQSKLDPTLCGTTAELLLSCLRDCAPLSLTKEPSDCLNGLENLLCSWLGEDVEEDTVPAKFDVQQQGNAAATLVALACARGSMKTFIHTVHLLQKLLTALPNLPVADVLYKLLQLEGGSGIPSSLMGSKHVVCWGFEDMLSDAEKSGDDKDSKDTEIGRSITTDGKFLYTTNSSGRGISKIGSGLHGTLRGYVYARNPEPEAGWVAYGDGYLIHRPAEYDQRPAQFIHIMDPSTLKVNQTIKMKCSLYTPELYLIPDRANFATIQLCSDGTYFYWVWVPTPTVGIDKSAMKGHTVYLDVFKLEEREGSVVGVPITSRVILQRKDESSKNVTDTLLAKLRPYRASTTATLVALTGGSLTTTTTKEDPSTTSCGITLKVLRKTPVYCCGNTVVMVTAPPGGNSNSTARSLFGSSSGLSGTRTLGVNFVYNVNDGQFSCRNEFSDAPTCALARGASVQGLGVCYDVWNNMLWTCSSEWVDQWYNPGHQAAHHVCQQLGITYQQMEEPKAQSLALSAVIQQLLQHVGSMCCHQIHSDMLATPLGSILLRNHPIDLTYMARICDILEKAIKEEDVGIVQCMLIVLQVIFKSYLFKNEEEEKHLVTRAGSLVWQLLISLKSLGMSGIEREVCHSISAGLHILYPTAEDQNTLLHKLLTEGDMNPGLARLRDLILVDLSEQLKTDAERGEDNTVSRLNVDLVSYILKIAVRESCLLLRRCQTATVEEFETLVASIPLSSPCLRYMMALQSYLLRQAVLYTKPKESKKGEEKTKETLSLETIQSCVLLMSKKIFTGCEEVLSVLLEVTNAVVSNNLPDFEDRIQGLERLIKATVLGHQLPVLITSLTHVNLRSLSMADALMPQLVQLVIQTSQAALLMKTQTQSSKVEDGMNTSSDADVFELLGALSTDSDLQEQEETGFLAGLKIPAPWATGKTVETIHPVRDNYKFRETVHIPGARCLYLRFDPRCSSQYDYDKLVVYAGPTTSSRKVAEYGGNTHGYGSRSVLGSGWPKDLVKVEGNTVTFAFEMRSGREHNTPDKAMWGFGCTVRAQESADEASHGLPFLADLALGLSVLGCTMLHLLYQGPEKTSDEEACQHLLKSKLLQRCVWQQESGKVPSEPVAATIREDEEHPTVAGTTLPRIKLTSDVICKFRELSGRIAPHFRPSIKEVLQPDVIEEAILSVAIKHLDLQECLQYFSSVDIPNEQRENYSLLCNVISEVYRRLDAIMRQIQALAELEQKWQQEVDDLRKGSLPLGIAFFADYHLQDTKGRELAFLCYLKDVTLDPLNLEEAVSTLREKLETEASLKEDENKIQTLSKTISLIAGISERAELLLHVNISKETSGVGTMARSVSQYPENNVPGAASDTSIQSYSGPVPLARSLSAPSELEGDVWDARHDMRRSHRWRGPRKGPTLLLQELISEESLGDKDKPAYSQVLDQLFAFIGSNLEKTVSCKSFLSSAHVRWRRGTTRKQALIHMKELLTAASRVGGGTHLVAAVTSVLQSGPRIEELTCGGMADHVREAFAETMTSVVQLSARYPIACCNSIGLLCIIPYTRSEEPCLVRSGLVQLLDKLCSLGSDRGDGNAETQSIRQRVSALAWAGFQVLANRCVSWETEEGSQDVLEHAGLARQVSALLTNHLARATESNGNEAAGSEALQEVLSLLNNLSRSRMGKAILSQPACVSKLLSLLLDQRPSPKLVLIILQLCHVALPLMSAEDCESVKLPSWGQEVLAGEDENLSDPPAKICSLLLAKLGDYVVPGGQTTATPTTEYPDQSALQSQTVPSTVERDKGEESEAQDGRISVFIHKREDQSSHEVIQPLLSSDGRPFRLGSGANMEKVVRMDREMTKHNKAEVMMDDAVTALRRAAKWAQSGLVVSTGPPIESSAQDNGGRDKKKTTSEAVCREKNSDLARTDPVRPFISGHVANSMASEVIGLLHGLLMAPETTTAQIWASAVERVLSHALTCVSQLTNTLLHHADLLSSCSNGDVIDGLTAVCRQAVAALCALGGFRESIKVGSAVEVIGEGVLPTAGQVISVSEQQGMATVKLDISPDDRSPRPSDTMEVTMTRLRPPKSEPLSLEQLSMTEKVAAALHSLLLPIDESGLSPLQTPLPATGDGSSIAMATCRILAEIRSRACMVLSAHMKESTFAAEFIRLSTRPMEILKSLAQQCSSGERLTVTEAQCERLRMLYRDCARPPPPPSNTIGRNNKEITWEPSRTFPPVRACLYSHGLTGITFLGDPSAGSGLPRGTMCYATQSIPSQAPSFYWELEICSYGESGDESGPIMSFGFAPAAERKDGAWTNPVGTVLFHNNGRAVHYNGSSLLQWKSVRLDITLNAGDIAGCGWERDGDSPPLPGQQVKGHVYFTYNGKRLTQTLDDVSGGLWPVVHIQKKNTRIRANFGSRSFAYAEGRQHRNAADECSDLTEEITANFGALPFHLGDDSDTEGSGTDLVSEITATEDNMPPGPPCRIAESSKELKEYNTDASILYKLHQSYDNFTSTGPDIRSMTATSTATQDEDSDDGDVEDEPQEDHHALLVKAWESKVFPVIRRRFRNEAERRSGLEQIKGALQLGMTDIARQTVEFLYEENGGMPRDLHLPTIEDIKAEAAKFTIERVRKGTSVVVRQYANETVSGGTVVPKFAVRGMLKTFGLTGVVLDVDSHNELVQVETYLRSEGVLVRYWYPIDMLERPPPGYRKNSTTGLSNIDTSNLHIHRELLRCEAAVTRMHCRGALLELINQCRSPIRQLPASLEDIEPALIAAAATAVPELDLTHLQLLSNDLLASPQPDGVITASSLTSTPSPWKCLASNTGSIIDAFYHDTHKLREELSIAIATAARHGEDHLMELTNQLCTCLQNAPSNFLCQVLPVTESKLNSDIHFPGASLLVVSCKADPKTAKKDSSLYKSPWARLYCYNIGHRVKKTGQTSRQEVISYPIEASLSSTGGLTAPPSSQIDQYPTVLLPCDKIHVHMGISPPPGVIITVHGLPPEFPLALAYLEMLTSGQVFKERACFGEMSDQPVVITSSILLHATELLTYYLWHTEVSAQVKEYAFLLLAQLLRRLHKTQQMESALPHPSPSLSLLMQLQQLQTELRKLYDSESQSGGSSGHHRHTTYFHALMEVCLALSEISTPMSTGSSLTGASSTGSVTGATSSVSTLPTAPTSPVTAAKRKKLKTKRISSTKRSLKPSDGDSAGDVGLSGSKPEDMLWFHRALTISLILRHLAYRESQGHAVTNDAVSDACQSLVSSTAHSRLLVISGIPTHLEEEVVRKGIMKSCNAQGGLYKEEIFIPTQEIELEESGLEANDTSRAEVKEQAQGQDMEERGVQAGMSNEPGPSGVLRVSESGTQQGSLAVPEDSETAEQGEPPVPDVTGHAATHAATDEQRYSEELRVEDIEFQDVTEAEANVDVVTTVAQEDVTMTTSEESKRNVGDKKDGNNEEVKTIQCVQGVAVIEVRSKAKVEDIKAALLRSKPPIGVCLTFGDDDVMDVTTETMLSVAGVNQSLIAESHTGDALDRYFEQKLITKKLSAGLNVKAIDTLTEIYTSCALAEQKLRLDTASKELVASDLILSKDQMLSQTPGNLLYQFFSNARPPKKSISEHVTHVLRQYGIAKPTKVKVQGKNGKDGEKAAKPIKKNSKGSKERLALGEVTAKVKTSSIEKRVKKQEKSAKETSEKTKTEDSKVKESSDDKVLTLEGFLQYVADKVKQDVRAVWRAIMACGYDLHFDRCACSDVAEALELCKKWTLEMDCALVSFVNSLCRRLAVTPARLHPHEIYLTEAQYANPDYNCLTGVPLESIRLRYALLQSLNTTLESFFLPLVDLRPYRTFSESTAALLANARGLVFYDTKTMLLNQILNSTAQRNLDQAAPEIILDPLQAVSGEPKDVMSSQFCQAFRQLCSIPSAQLCVRIASGGDPTYSFNVRLTGEEVHGTSGSFRHFLWQVTHELQSPILKLLMQCPSSSTGRNKGQYILRPGPMTYAEEKLLQFFGQLLGVSIRADIPISMDLLSTFWKCVVDVPLDCEEDLKEADIVTYKFIKKLEQLEDESEFTEMCSESGPYRFTYSSMTGTEVELKRGGRNIYVSWENRLEYVEAVTRLRMQELECSGQLLAVRCGLASVIPMQLLPLMTPQDMELRTCGQPTVDLDFLKSHTMYQVGLMETDTHIEYFWNALESFSQEELCKFVKFACNQERIPCTCPCKDGNAETAHVPPYPMKIAPPDGPSGSPDSRFIRVETCMFMIKLPQYSSQQIMTDRLLYAINCREDPLSG